MDAGKAGPEDEGGAGIQADLLAHIPDQQSEDVAAAAAELIHCRRLRAQLKVRWHLANLVGLSDGDGGSVNADSIEREVHSLDRQVALLERLLTVRQVPGPPGQSEPAGVTPITLPAGPGLRHPVDVA
jgi:hypothetical protein